LTHFAHSKPGRPKEEWQTIEEHLSNVARLARQLGESSGTQRWSEAAGRWHDLGKFSQEFQWRIGAGDPASTETVPGAVDHSTAGAQHAHVVLGDLGLPLSYAIAGHHAGLANWYDSTDSHLKGRLNRRIPDWSVAPESMTACDGFSPTDFPFVPDQKRLGIQVFLFSKMLFSSLVDADFLDTEAFLDPGRSKARTHEWDLRELKDAFDRYMQGLKGTSRIDAIRGGILRAARAAAIHGPGMFRMTVPTGGGKTLSSMGFALDHAIHHGLQRIIYVIPYTSIIEQNAAVFRTVFGEVNGESPVLEHHSNFDPGGEYEWSRLASENWDAPLVVTTNVQFFESIFNHRVSRNRKLHNIANSVVILDEAQSLPPGLLNPTLRAMEEFSETYRTSFVFCTATQPAIVRRDDFSAGIANVQEIVPDVPKLFAGLKRTQIVYDGAKSNDDLASEIGGQKQALVIVSTRKHARDLYHAVRGTHPDETVFHLSALMYPEHRKRVLDEIRTRLAENLPTILISTQLIEAGVDIDFPVVYRSIAGIDSIAQAAGRCNREGRGNQPGHVVVFDPIDAPTPRAFKRAIEVARIVMESHNDLLAPAAVEDYFREMYWRQDMHNKLDNGEIMTKKLDARNAAAFHIPFRDISDSYRLIEDASHSIIIDPGACDKDWRNKDHKTVSALTRQLEWATSGKRILRELQRYTVSVYERTLSQLQNEGAITTPREGVYVLNNPRAYHDETGLIEEEAGVRDATQMMI
jgi:CRISPR-associated endonuclease/helicase Cas3